MSSRPSRPTKITSPEELQARLAAIIASTDDGIVSKDLNGIIESWNTGAERIFGYRADEVIGKPITILFPPERVDEELGILDHIRHGRRIDHFETVRVRKDGERIFVSVTISPVHDGTGRIIGASKIVRDITALRQYELERERLLEREQAARLQAEQHSRAKDEFLAAVSHELRTPLNAILGWATLLRAAGDNPEEMKQGLEAIERNARVQAQLINDLLDMSRIISGKLRLEIGPVDLRLVVADSIESVVPAADARQIEIRRHFNSGTTIVTGDAGRLQQVIWNLLSNAIKFTPRGGTVDITLARAQSHIELRVTDTGQGIRSDFLPRLFTRFSQADGSTTRTHGGLGLGLAIVRHLVELHGGSVSAESLGEGQGSTFTVALPIPPLLEADSSAGPTVAHGREIPIDLSGVKVLVVDDEADGRLLAQRILESANASVVTAESVAQALSLLREHRPHVLLSDIAMPEADGYELIRKVRLLDPSDGGNIPAAAMSAYARPEARRKALATGFQLYLAKPIEPGDLIAAVASLSNRTAPPTARPRAGGDASSSSTTESR